MAQPASEKIKITEKMKNNTEKITRAHDAVSSKEKRI